MHFCVLTIRQQENVTYIADIRINVITNHAVGNTQKYNDGGVQYDAPLWSPEHYFTLFCLHNDPPFVLLCGCHSGQLTVLPKAETHCDHHSTNIAGVYYCHSAENLGMPSCILHESTDRRWKLPDAGVGLVRNCEQMECNNYWYESGSELQRPTNRGAAVALDGG